ENGNRKTQLRCIKIGVVPSDNTGFFECANPAQTRWCGQPDTVRKLDVGHPTFVLKFRQQAPVN
ncbi:MAG: hypothetical protein RIQ99_512, partial [Pseudomonadota bacterium]